MTLTEQTLLELQARRIDKLQRLTGLQAQQLKELQALLVKLAEAIERLTNE